MDSLTSQGGFVFVDYHTGAAAGRFDKARALGPVLAQGFIQTTQPKLWQSLQALHAHDTANLPPPLPS